MPRNRLSHLNILVTLPDSVVHNVNLPTNATGMDCLEKMCSLLGIVEVDYFGLRFIDHHGIYLWLNLRMKLTTQLKGASSPYQLYFKVKYFVDPKTLQQPSTKHLFYLQAKALMAKGQLPVPIKEANKIGALIAQSDLGNSNKFQDKLCYPQYFKDWARGIARGIAKEHSKLNGMDSRLAQDQLLNRAFKLENWGVSYMKVVNTEDNSVCYLGIGGLNIRICNSEWKLIKKISYDYLLEASFRNRIFTIAYRSLNTQGEQVDKHLLFKCQHHRIARYLFRVLTEDHTFFCHETVSNRVLEHVRTRLWQEIGTKYFGLNYDCIYHFDVIRTQHEAFSNAWSKLHQVDQSTTIRLRPSTAIYTQDDTSSSSNEREYDHPTFSDTSLVSSDLSHINLIQFGLSKSSCDIAKELLQNPSTTTSTDDDSSPCSSSSLSDTSMMSTLQTKEKLHDEENEKTSKSKAGSICLTKEGSVKLGQFIQKIVDSKLCRVCMDNPVSAVFCPCGHLISCYKCALECTQCPMCRSTIAYVQYVYGCSGP